MQTVMLELHLTLLHLTNKIPCRFHCNEERFTGNLSSLINCHSFVTIPRYTLIERMTSALLRILIRLLFRLRCDEPCEWFTIR